MNVILCSVWCVPCGVFHGVYSMERIPCSVFSVVCSMWCFQWSVFHVVCSVWCVPCDAFHVVCSCGVFLVMHSMCCLPYERYGVVILCIKHISFNILMQQNTYIIKIDHKNGKCYSYQSKLSTLMIKVLRTISAICRSHLKLTVFR